MTLEALVKETGNSRRLMCLRLLMNQDLGQTIVSLLQCFEILNHM